jgi:hypothetical protein
MLIFPHASIKPKAGTDDAENAHGCPQIVVVSGLGTAVVCRRLRKVFLFGEGEAMDVIPHNDNQLARALGEAVLAIWGKLPHDIQHRVFEQAVLSQGESIRQQLAVLLHGKHPRTSDPLGKPREMMEPDSLGG